jgi:DNA-binding transcriptional regulator LsrR (DeoR family)
MKKGHGKPLPTERAAETDSEELILEVARCYYEQKLTQEEIGKQINVSRSTVSRLLEQARDRGIVHIRINYPWQRAHDLEQRLVATFGLKDARVLKSKEKDEEEVRRGTGVLAARLLDGHLQDGQILALSYGRSLASTVAALGPNRQVAMTVVQAIGAPGSDNPSIDGADLVRRFAHAYSCEYRYLPAPLLVADARTREALIQLPQVYETLNLAKRADIMLVGIGALPPEVSSGIWEGYLTKRELARQEKGGAVGHMCCEFFDANGRVLDLKVNRRSIGIGIKTLSTIDLVIAVASGKAKTQAILGALRGKHLKILVTDDAAATAVLELEEASSANRLAIA